MRGFPLGFFQDFLLVFAFQSFVLWYVYLYLYLELVEFPGCGDYGFSINVGNFCHFSSCFFPPKLKQICPLITGNKCSKREIWSYLLEHIGHSHNKLITWFESLMGLKVWESAMCKGVIKFWQKWVFPNQYAI